MSEPIDIVRESLASLPDFDRQAFRLWRYEGKDFPAIAVMLSSTADEVKRACVRATQHGIDALTAAGVSPDA